MRMAHRGSCLYGDPRGLVDTLMTGHFEADSGAWIQIPMLLGIRSPLNSQVLHVPVKSLCVQT